MLIRFEFVDIDGVVLNTGIAECNSSQDFIEEEDKFEDIFGYNDSKYNSETNEFYDKCIKTEVKEILAFDPAEMLAKKMMSFM